MISRRVMLAMAAAGPASAAWAEAPKPGLPQVVVGDIHLDDNERLWTPVTIGGRGPFRFIVDTGASVSGMDESLGTMLGLKSLNKLEVSGVAGSKEVDVFLATNVVIGNAFSQKEMALLGMGNLGADTGLLAAGVLTFYDSEIDVVAEKFRLFPMGQTNREGYSRVGGRWITTVNGASKQLHVQAMIDGQVAELMVDTGASTSILLGAAWLRRNKAQWAKTRYVEQEGRGTTGMFDGRVVRADIKLGEIEFKAEAIQLVDPDTKTSMGHDGLLGIDILRRFTFAFESKKAGLWLKPNGVNPGPDAYNRSGFRIDATPRPATIRSVQPNSPAGRAGLVAGDILPALTDRETIYNLSGEQYGDAGQSMTFDVEHGGKRRTVTLMLEDLI